MSDAFRQSNTDKVASTIKPDSQKTYTEKTTEQVKGKSDGIARHAQPNSEKSTGQSLTDSLSGGTSNTSSSNNGIAQQASDMLGNASKTVQDTLGLGGSNTGSTTK